MMQLARLRAGIPYNQTSYTSMPQLPYNQLVSPSDVHSAWYSLPQMSTGFGQSIQPQTEHLVQSTPKRLQTSSVSDFQRAKKSVPGGNRRSRRSLESLYMSRVYSSPSTNTDPGVVTPPVTSSTMHPLRCTMQHPSILETSGVCQLDLDYEVDV